jgi:hypothetical protein
LGESVFDPADELAKGPVKSAFLRVEKISAVGIGQIRKGQQYSAAGP